MFSRQDRPCVRRGQRAHTKGLVARTADVLRPAGFNVTTLVEEGHPVTKIIGHATAWKADLIVLGSHGRTGFDRLLLGSVSEGVARHAPCTVEIVRLPAERAARAA
jgi:nucleotide-binding universal stress UspA family protein